MVERVFRSPDETGEGPSKGVVHGVEETTTNNNQQGTGVWDAMTETVALAEMS
jgi:hypothetical protein